MSEILHYELGDGEYLIFDADDCPVAIVSGGNQKTDLEYAKKFAAAPQLYELAKDTLAHFEGEWEAVGNHPASMWSDWVESIRATLALVNGND